jgi:hypothetical protein
MKRTKVLERYKSLKPWIAGKTVLHIGCVQHDWKESEKDTWIHSYIAEHAKETLGIDIQEEGIIELGKRGYNVRTADAESFDLNTRFEVIFAGELIEHLQDFRGFFNSCQRHMNASSKLIITTPNSFGAIYFLTRLLGIKFINPEHTCWFDEQTLGQTLNRNGFKVINKKLLPTFSNKLNGIQNSILKIVETPLWKFRGTLFMVSEKQGADTSSKSIKQKTCIVIPAVNEETTIGDIIKKTREYIDAIIVVNNGSTDNTARIARDCGATVIDYSAKRGYGAAQYAGQQFALQQGYDYILQLDADGQHDPNYIPQLLETMQNSDYDIVLGSRFLTASYKDFSFMRKAGISFFSKIVSFLAHSKITDVTSGFKIYRASSLRKLSKPSDINPAVEQMAEIAKKGMKIKEIPIEMSVRNTGESHLSLLKFAFYPIRASWLILKVILFK